MPRVPDEILNGIIYLYPDRDSADTGTAFGGSGFLLMMNSSIGGNAHHIYAVTNRHVVRDGSPVVRINLKFPSGNTRTEVFPFTASSWIQDESHDIAVRPFPPDFDPTYLQYGLFTFDHHLMSEEYFAANDVGPGDDLFYIGRFRDHAGKYENIPSVRFGTISMNPHVREQVKIYDKHLGRELSEMVFLVEARSRSGYSGSPVFFYDLMDTTRPRLALLMTYRFGKGFKILGLDCAHIPEEIDVFSSTTGAELPIKAWVHSGMMAVVPAWYLRDFLLTAPALIEQRARDDEYYRTHPPRAVPDA